MSAELVLEQIHPQSLWIRLKGRSEYYKPVGRPLGVFLFFLKEENWGRSFHRSEVEEGVGSYNMLNITATVRSINGFLGAEVIKLQRIEGTSQYLYVSNIKCVEVLNK